MLKMLFVIFFMLLLSYSPAICYAEGNVFAILGKSRDDYNFKSVVDGCNKFAKRNGDSCINISSEGAAHPRSQSKALLRAIRRFRLHAVAVSVVNSKSLAKIINWYKSRVPIITFDSPFSLADIEAEMVYIGPNNVSIGRSLAAIAQKSYPNGGTVCIMTDRNDPNLLQRVSGVRMELSCNSSFPGDKRLEGENGWTESVFSPINSGDCVDRTLAILDKIVNQIKPDVFIAVGHWPILDASGYRRIMEEHNTILPDERVFIACATGEATDEMKKLVEDNLLNAIVGFDFFKIGELCYECMDLLSKKQPVPLKVDVPLFTITSESGK
ncbi:substrate-binding domain-containing protein [Maridesulfovibrio sp.]|uniref:substrate-binding domain-containing protein n=1 Tax=Maridesulfovibrio sp. TaxID=2795000 RepID=UPI002A18CCF8|nr:substrate-binding domain-containing protein [Maridesulfovibrio sp.]